MAILTAKNLAVGYEKQPVLKDINFKIESGDYFCIVGENGSGKTTLMKTILGLLPPVEGSIEVGQGLMKNQIGYLPQQSDVQRDFPATVYEIVLSGCQNSLKGFFYSKAQKKMALENIERMGISHLKNKCYRQLSGGQQQRVLLARALCATTKVLLLDEPVAGLDPNVTKEMYELIGQLNSQGLTVIMISHDLENVKKYATAIFDVNKLDVIKTSDEIQSSKEVGAC
ncbi:zinc transport system ATP-binding protein [Pseudobutyrivibrio sp. NOR37]|uniref:ABC transporter ATP-binding protein n=1 Tax=Pseudobutyrivibrio xylanivorans TaxID=185007 RepID=A0A6M0LJB1_PSEXY|nr:MULTISPECIES: ABC transporter ATP-binding protein [Pseudobutyrivibrio]NEX02592.1 ABC transporter ATP-binding protein [Pseudobutyrivibrio xylanivorans]SFR82219.1 zinc transport system ATP-binding protein [Pseudobutyrivibrio sp. NOR37]